MTEQITALARAMGAEGTEELLTALCRAAETRDYCARPGLTEGVLANAAHIVWATGGSKVPKAEKQHYYEEGKKA